MSKAFFSCFASHLFLQNITAKTSLSAIPFMKGGFCHSNLDMVLLCSIRRKLNSMHSIFPYSPWNVWVTKRITLLSVFTIQWTPQSDKFSDLVSTNMKRFSHWIIMPIYFMNGFVQCVIFSLSARVLFAERNNLTLYGCRAFFVELIVWIIFPWRGGLPYARGESNSLHSLSLVLSLDSSGTAVSAFNLC